MKKSIKLIALFVILALSLLTVACAPEDPNKDVPQADITLDVGDVMSLKANEGFYADYLYASSDEQVATISANGELRAISEGTAKITAKRGEIIVYEYTLTVVDSGYVAPVEQDTPSYNITLSKYESVMLLGSSATIKAELTKNGYKSDETIAYSVEDTTVASITTTTDGVKVTALKIGQTVLKAKIGGFTANCVIKVYSVNSKPLDTPVVTTLSSEELGWDSVQNASNYRVSLDGGSSWTETTETSFALSSSVNPFQIRVVAKSTSADYQESKNGVISPDMFVITDGKGIKLCIDKTLSGADNDKFRETSLTLKVVTKNSVYDVDQKYITWASLDSKVAEVEGAKVFPASVGETKISAYLIGGSVSDEVLVGTPISSKADMDALANCNTDGSSALWSADKKYILTNDIDYSNGGSALWHERYIRPIALSRYHSTAGTYGGIYGAVPFYNGQQIFKARIEGQGYAIKNAIIPLGVAFKQDQGFGITTYGQNWIHNLSGEVANIKFENLTYENASQAIANPYMYNVATNPLLEELLADKNNDGYDDNSAFSFGSQTLGIPVISSNGVVSGIDISKVQKTCTWSNESQKATMSQGTGLIGVLNAGTIDSVYIDANIHTGASYFSTIQVQSGVLVAIVNPNATGATAKSKIINCVIVPRLTEGVFTPGISYNGSTVSAKYEHTKYTGAIVGLNRETVATDTIENCAVLLESGSGLATNNTFNAYIGIQVYGGRFYNSPESVGGAYRYDEHIDRHGLKNVKIYEAIGSNTALNQYMTDTDFHK